MGASEKEKKALSGHTAVSNRPADKEFFIDEFVTEPPSSGEGAESAAPADDGHEEIVGQVFKRVYQQGG